MEIVTLENKVVTLTKENIWQYYAPVYAILTPKIQHELLSYVGNIVFGNVLDAGTGSGKIIDKIDYSKINSFIGIDTNSEMLKEARKKNINTNSTINLCFKKDNVITHSGTYDSIASVNVLYTLSENDGLAFLEKSFQNLTPNGFLIIASPNKSLNMEQIIEKVDEEFENEDKTTKKYYEIYKKCNQFLADQAKELGFRPSLYSSDELINKLKGIGFRKITDVLNKHYYNTLFTIIVQK